MYNNPQNSKLQNLSFNGVRQIFYCIFAIVKIFFFEKFKKFLHKYTLLHTKNSVKSFESKFQVSWPTLMYSEPTKSSPTSTSGKGGAFRGTILLLESNWTYDKGLRTMFISLSNKN